MRKTLSLFLAVVLLFGLLAPAATATGNYEVIEDWVDADLTDTTKYVTSNAGLTAGKDDTVGDFVTMKATNYNPSLTINAVITASKYAEPTVGIWMKQTRTNEGTVKLLSGESVTDEATFTPVADEWVFVTIPVTADATAIQFVPYTYGNPSIGAIYFGSKADVEKIPNSSETTDPEPATPGGQGRWVLVDNFESGKMSSNYSVNDSYEVVNSDIGNYSAYNPGNAGYLKYDKDLPAADYETPAIAFWAKGTEGKTVMFWGNNPLGSVTLHEEWTYYVFTSGLKSLINASGTGCLDYIRLWSAKDTEVWLDQIYFGEAEDLAVAPDQEEGYDFYQIIPGEESTPEAAYEVVEGWSSADLTDTAKYVTANCTVTAGTDDTIGGYVAMKATEYNPAFTVVCSFDATKYTDPTVGFWVKQTRTNAGTVYLQSGSNNVAEASFTPVADTWIFVTVSLPTSADAIRFVPFVYGNPSIGSIYLGNKADVEKIPDEFDFSEPDPTDPDPTDPDPTDPDPTDPEPGVPGGQGRWVLVDNFESGQISSKYSVNDNYEVVNSDIGNYSAYNPGNSGYLKYDKDLPAADYETPAIAFWAKGTEGKALMFWGSSPLGTVTLHEEWTYYVFTSGLKSLINASGSGGIDTSSLEYLTKEEKAAAIITKRFTDMLIRHFDYHELALIETHHFSAGSVDNDPILRKYNVDVIVATPKKPDDSVFTDFINTINESTELSIEYCWDLSDDQMKSINYFQWCKLDCLLEDEVTYEGRKVRGLQEITAAVGRKAISSYAKRSIRLSSDDVQSKIVELIQTVDEKTTAKA
ncbi:MAG: hypothetical protein ACI4V3_04695 [Faecousia sp.]